MYKNLIIKISLFCLCSVSFAQDYIEQKSVLISTQDRSKVKNFQESIKIKIDNHKKEIIAKKEILDQEKESLINDVKSAKQQNNGVLSAEQKAYFKNRRDIIQIKILKLQEENNQFLTHIDKERDTFFSSFKK